MSHIGALIRQRLAESAPPPIVETDPDPAWFEAACPACGQIVWWQTTGRDNGRTFSHEIHCDCVEPAA